MLASQLIRRRTWTPSYSRHLFIGLFGIAFALFNLAYFVLLSLPLDLLALLYLLLIEYGTFGLAYEITELILEQLLPEIIVPFEPPTAQGPAVAILYCICDDLNHGALECLQQCVYSNLRIFILDDSCHHDYSKTTDALGVTVVRRDNRVGYKAGNLNNWLTLYGHLFPYFIVLDTDSILPTDFVTRMVGYAEHPLNNDVAMFESAIVPWNTTSPFTYHQSVLARCGRRIPLKVGNRFWSNLSVGHNDLFRTAAIREAGGFSEDYVAEDYATCVKLLNRSWRCVAVPVDSYERVPANIAEYSKRRIRHACQTFQLGSLNVQGLTWAARLRLIKAVYYYTQPVVSMIAAILLIYLNASHIAVNLKMPGNHGVANFGDYLWFTGFWVLIWLLPIIILLVRAKALHLPAGECLETLLFEAAVFSVTAWSVVCGQVRYWVRGRRHLEFEITGTEPRPSFGRVLKMAGPGLVIYLASLVSVLLNPILSGLNLLWLAPAVLSPLIVYRYQEARHDRRSENQLP